MLKNLFLFTLLLIISTSSYADDKFESVYNRVMATKTLKCAYLPYEPYIKKDLITGELSGIIVDYVEEVSKKSGLSVDWAGEVNIDQVVPAMNAKRFDAFCIPATPDKNWAEKLGFEASLGGLPYYTYVPFDSTLTDETLQTAKFAVVDGYALTPFTKTAFPKAEYISLPQTVSVAEMYDQLRYKKVDAHVNEHISASNYIKNNPDTIRRYSDKLVIAAQMFLVVAHDDTKMREFVRNIFDSSTGENAKLMSDLLEKYSVEKGSWLVGEECVGETGANEERLCKISK